MLRKVEEQKSKVEVEELSLFNAFKDQYSDQTTNTSITNYPYNSDNNAMNNVKTEKNGNNR